MERMGRFDPGRRARPRRRRARQDPAPTSVSVHWLSLCDFGDGTRDFVRSFRSFDALPFQLADRAAWRWFDAMERRHGKGNVWIEYD